MSQELIILAVPQQIVGLCFDLIALPDQAACFVNDHPEHANGRRIKWQRQSDRWARRLEHPSESRLADLAADDIPSCCHKLLLRQRRDACWGRKGIEEGKEPIAAAVPPEAIDLGKIQRQVVVRMRCWISV
ncbi:hypothetical protein X753_13845 [Mesorhizobium sp. LNJC399B00]|nr:hypothetical protein X753_13845 [Mesorhizobium sp. LNJC399B00]